jgi:Rha family phage regulatory protein
MAAKFIPSPVVQVKDSPDNLISVDFLDESTPVVSSRDVAHHFQKAHKEVLRDIERIRSVIPGDFTKRNFALCHYSNKLSNDKPYPYYHLTRDGFSLLAMGFTGAAGK